MNGQHGAKPPGKPGPKVVRCAIYTRKSTEEGLNQEFNTLDAQRDSGVAFIASQKQEGWVCLPEKYDDGGFTGGNIDRPALKRLMEDIEAGKVDCVVVYKVDRLSRSLMDFARLMELFDRKGVSFVSVTQQFNTTHSMGRLTLNILLSFAQFEREIISERTRDKIAAARRKGKYALGKPLLGYDYVPAPAPFTGRRLVPNKREAERVRRMFEMYLEEKSLIRVADECNARGWTTKTWTTTSGRIVGQRKFDKVIISRLLRNPIYIGKVPHHENLYDGEHEAIVDRELFDRVQARLKAAAAAGGAYVNQQTGMGPALLRGLVRCKACKCAMTATSSSQELISGATVRYRYYVCCNAVKRGRATCPNPSVPGAELEAFVVGQIKALLSQDESLRAVVGRALELLSQAAEARVGERDRLCAVVERLREAGDEDSTREIERTQRRITALDQQIAADSSRVVDEDELVGAVEAFDGVWTAMTAAERCELLRALVASVEFDGVSQAVTVTFQAGIGGLPPHQPSRPAKRDSR
ncbi:MAG: recombinase family protein [Sorangiineae bacterium PRO1]|nr:recombinase family protein [Sorangiineae bacterium PRO1]